MRRSFKGSRVGGTHGSWVFFPTVLFLHYARLIYDSHELFCSASSSGEVWPQEVAGDAEDSASLTSKDIFRISLQRRHRDSRSSSSPSNGKENFSFLQDKLAAETDLLYNAARIGGPQPVASIPVCVKPHVERLLNYAFDVLVYNQQRYLLTRREEKTDRPGAEQTGKKEGEEKEGLEEGKGDGDSGEDRMKPLGEEVSVTFDAEKCRRERLAEYTRMCILLSLMSKVGESARLPGVSEWTRVNGSTDNRDEDFERQPLCASLLGPSPTQNDWERAYARLLSQLKGSLRENNELASTEEAAGLHPLSHDNAILHDLHKNRQVEELAALLPEVGQTSLPNEPEKADVYLSLLIADEESMDLWRSHIVRHVFEHFTFASCSPEKAALTSAAAPMEAEAAAQTDAARRKDEPAERPVEGQGEGVAPEAEQKGGRRTDSLFRLGAAPKDSNVDSSSLHGPRTAHDGSTRGGVEEREAHPAGGGEEAIHGNQEGGTRREAKGNSIWNEGLLNANWNGVHDVLLRELQQQFWMARPATSAAAVQMIHMTRQWQQQQEQHRQGDGGQQQENLERGRPGRGQQQTQQEEKQPQQNEQEQQDLEEKNDAEVEKLLTKEERGRSRSNEGKGAVVRGAPWEAEVSIRFRFVSMKDAQRMMGTFLTSNLHPEMGFPTGTKVPPKSRSSSSRGTAPGGAATGNGEKEQEKTRGDAGTGRPREAGETEQDEGDEQQVPDYFDARDAFPACKDVIGHVRDQGNCGSCWAFSATTSFNDRLCIRSGGEMRQLLSTQHTTSCCDLLRCASYGCKGGEPGFAWRWFSRSGVVSGGDYDTLHTGKTCWPYELPFCNHNTKGPFPDCDKSHEYVETPVCRSECEEPEYTKNVRPFAQDLHYAARTYSFPTPMHAKKDIMRSGSISASFMVYEDLLTYKSGVYKHVYGSPLGGHSAKAIGWGVEGDEKYWLLVNSWNTYWGENGLVKFRMGDAGIDDDLVAGDASWKPHADQLERDKKPNDASSLPAEDSNVHTYREL